MNILYAAFDVFPMPKGASTHIAHTVTALKNFFDTVHLVVLGAGEMPGYQVEENVVIHRCMVRHPNFLKRTEYFGAFLSDVLSKIPRMPEIIHFRDIWSGMPVLGHSRTQKSRMIFEVNGLPSIELPYRYPELLKNRVLMDKIQGMEDHCLVSAHDIYTVSEVNKRCLVSRGTDPDRIFVIPNTVGATRTVISNTNADTAAADQSDQSDESDQSDTGMILYVGTLSPWQGVHVLLKAFSMVSDHDHWKLVLACSTKKHIRPVRKLIRKLGIQQSVDLKIGLPRRKVYKLFREAVFSAAPLTRCSRNEIQGCSPFKIMESMHAGTPVIASRLAVCSEIIEHGKDGWLVAPDSPRALAAAMEYLMDNREQLEYLGKNARIKISEHFGFDIWEKRLLNIYEKL